MRVLLREVGEELARCELTFLERQTIDLERAREQHAAFARLLAQLGCEVQILPALAGHPDAAFVEDTALLLGRVAVLARPGVAARQGEVLAMADVLAPQYRLLHLPESATLEGGDVLRVDDVLYVGQSRRTNHAGLKALAHLVLNEGLRVKAVEVRGCLHLETAACDLGQGRILVRPDWVDLRRLADLERIEVDAREPFGANVLRIHETIIASSAAPRTIERLLAAGLDVRVVEIDELHKAEAGVTCLVLCERA